MRQPVHVLRGHQAARLLIDRDHLRRLLIGQRLRTRQAIRRGTYTSVKELIAAVEKFTDGWNERCQPFTRAKTADQILTKATHKKTSDTQCSVHGMQKKSD